MPQASKEETKKPVDKFTDGRVHVSIWENSGIRGAFRAATFQLRYRDEKTGWQTGRSYGASDCKSLENAAKEARTRIQNWKQANKAESSPKAAA
jgi:hypothetical protein